MFRSKVLLGAALLPRVAHRPKKVQEERDTCEEAATRGEPASTKEDLDRLWNMFCRLRRSSHRNLKNPPLSQTKSSAETLGKTSYRGARLQRTTFIETSPRNGTKGCLALPSKADKAEELSQVLLWIAKHSAKGSTGNGSNQLLLFDVEEEEGKLLKEVEERVTDELIHGKSGKRSSLKTTSTL
jgi:hypothetical protein